MKPEIRPCTESDLDAVKILFEEFVSFHASLDNSFEKVKHHADLFAEYVRDNLKNEKSRILLAVQEGTTAGYIFGQIMLKSPVYASPRYGYVDNLAVAGPYQKLGIGTRLVESLMEWFREEKIDRIEIFAALANPKSTSFWRKMGFSPFIEQMSMKL